LNPTEQYVASNDYEDETIRTQFYNSTEIRKQRKQQTQRTPDQDPQRNDIRMHWSQWAQSNECFYTFDPKSEQDQHPEPSETGTVPIIKAKLINKTRRKRLHTHELEILIDSGSSYNLISSEVANTVASAGDKLDCVGPLPTFKTIAGKHVKAIKAMKLSMKAGNNKETEERIFFVFQNLPVDAVIGSNTCKQWQAQLNWKTDEFIHVMQDGSSQTVKFEIQNGNQWQAALALRVKHDIIIQPGNHAKCQVRYNANDICKDGEMYVRFGIISAGYQNGTKPIMIAPGPSYNPTWVQVANPTPAPILLRRGTPIAYMNETSEAMCESITVDFAKDSNKLSTSPSYFDQNTID
jgi:hypothetical protein